MRRWCRDGDSSSGLPVESRRVLATRRSRRIGSPTRTRTWIDGLTTGRPAVGRSGNGWSTSDSNRAQPPCKGGPRTPRVSRITFSIGGQTLAPRATEQWRERVRPPRIGGAWGRFRAHLSASSVRRFHQISFPGDMDFGAADGNRTHVCALATHGSAIELRTHRAQGWRGVLEARLRHDCAQIKMVHRAGLEPAKHIGT